MNNSDDFYFILIEILLFETKNYLQKELGFK